MAVGSGQGGGRGGRGDHRHGAAAERHLALGHVGNGLAFEQIGTVQDGINTLAQSPSVVDCADAQPMCVTRGDIRFEAVSFAYGAGANSAQPVIDDLNLHIRAGEKIGLVGRSGAGKSTVVNLLLRFYDLRQGRVLIDGQDIALGTQDSLRAQIGMVTQDTSLLHRSVSDNIRYGRPRPATPRWLPRRSAPRRTSSSWP